MTIEELRAAAAVAKDASAARELEEISRELIARCEEAGNRSELAYAYGYLGAARLLHNDGIGAKASYRRSYELFEELGDRLGCARGLVGMGLVATDVDLDFATARRLYDEALPIVRASDDRRFLAILLGNLTEVLRLESDYDLAIRTARESIDIFRALGDGSRVAWQLIDLAHCLFMRRERKAAFGTMREAYASLTTRVEDVRRLAEYFDVWFIMAAEMGAWTTAARLLGFVHALRDENNLVQSPSLLPWNSRPRERISAHLDEKEFEALLHEGAQYSVEAADALTESLAKLL